MNSAVGMTHFVDAASAAGRRLLSVDLGWRNFVFSLRMAAAAILAMAIAYRLELSDPQWATLTVYLLAQPTVGGALSKGTWRAIGTVGGGLLGLLIVGLFSQAPELLVAATVLMVGVIFYTGARLRNFASYGVLLAGYTAVLVAYEGSSDPLNAWSIAIDRIGAILIGIGCITAVSMIVLPRYAGDALREALTNTFRDLAGYVATALRLSASPDVFARQRQHMVAEVVSFDALRSSALFEAPEMRANATGLQRIVREFLILLAVARGLFVRLDAFEGEGAQAVGERFRPTLEAIASRVERVSADPLIWRDPGQLRGELLTARKELDKASADLEGMAGTAPFDPLANGVLIVSRVGKLLHGLAMVVVAEAASRRAQDVRMPSRSGARPLDREDRREALLIAIRASVAMLLLSAAWMASGWSEGFTAVSGGAIMLFFAVNQDNPQAAARTYLVWTAVGILLGYLVMVLLLPHLEGFEALALVLLIALLPAGLMAGTPSRSLAGVAFGAFTLSNLTTGNSFTPNELGFVSNAVAILLGMVICLAVIVAMPVTSQAKRERIWRHTIGTILPAVARGASPPRRAAGDIVAALTALLPRLALDRQRDEEFLRGTLGAASCAVELGRLVELKADPDMPQDIALSLGHFLQRFASALEGLVTERRMGPADRLSRLAEAETIVADMRAALSSWPLAPGPAARSLLHAGASLRFISDRFDIDRAYLGHGFDED
ncbi:FUSC family protein [Rhizobium sp. BK251]|uniref:FUSC family protein n=1 Tax=Rhizobium sp. BK251 TaxID=2512125 RepID=UPI0010E91D35|nr:FUSC family protein [Rhizobium sp. BK251]TCL72652.1 putative membrane protein YccC [Rhizobium sp. BK251]